MTTTVIVKAHCHEDYEVVVMAKAEGMIPAVLFLLKNGEEATAYAYGDRSIVVLERKRT